MWDQKWYLHIITLQLLQSKANFWIMWLLDFTLIFSPLNGNTVREDWTTPICNKCVFSFRKLFFSYFCYRTDAQIWQLKNKWNKWFLTWYAHDIHVLYFRFAWTLKATAALSTLDPPARAGNLHPVQLCHSEHVVVFQWRWFKGYLAGGQLSSPLPGDSSVSI